MNHHEILDDFDFEGNAVPDWAGEGEVVAKFFSSMEAELAAARLRSEGIHCFLANSATQSVMPHIQSVIRLHVRPADAETATNILLEAAQEAGPQHNSDSGGMGAVLILAILIGVLLAFFLVKALTIP